MLGKKVAKNIKKYREDSAISQRELGRRIDKTGQYISYLEKENNPNIGTDVMEDIAEALDISVYKLMDKPSGLTVGVSVKDTKQFKLLIDMTKDMLTDERIDKEVREEYYHRYLKEVEGEGAITEG
jgi:transcriptional regulator with XRE-family HTH domain